MVSGQVLLRIGDRLDAELGTHNGALVSLAKRIDSTNVIEVFVSQKDVRHMSHTGGCQGAQ
jgi:hypothetical protein